MRFSNIDFNIVYIDPSVETAGDGTTPENALKDLPAVDSMVDKTCFIIRRTSTLYVCNVPSGSTTALKHILFMGMPLFTDTAYMFVPEEAKTAWGGDSEQYAQFACAAAATSMNLGTLHTLLFHRINIERSSTSATQWLIQSYQSGEFTGTYALEHCRMGVKDCAIDSDKWTGTAYTNTAMFRYFYFGALRYLSIRDCIINYRLYSSDYPAIYCRYPDVLSIEDTQVNMLASDNNRTNYALNLCGSSDIQGTEVLLNNVSFRYVFNGTSSRYFSGGLNIGYHLSTRISNVTATSVIPQGMELPTDYCIPTQMLLNCSTLQDFCIRDITVKLPHFWRLYSHLLSFVGKLTSYSPGIERELSNIDITLGTDETVGLNGAYSYSDYQNTSSNYDYYALYASFESSASSYHKPCRVDNLNVSFARGKAANLRFCRVTNSTIAGMLCLSYSVADITKLSTWFPGYAMKMYSGSDVRIDTLEVNRENDSYVYSYDPAIERDKTSCTCFITQSNVIPEQIELSSSSTGQQYTVACASEVESGHYTLRTQNIAVDAWNVHRTGGAASSLKLWNSKWNNVGMVVLGRKPFKGRLLSVSEAGRYILKCHIAYKNYVNEEEMNKRFFIIATTDENNAPQTWCSSTCGRWIDDNEAVWENDSDLVQKCLELPIDVTTAGDIDVRLYFSWFSADGFLYVDPAMELVATT